jgi:phosphatidylserine decarboxylase
MKKLLPLLVVASVFVYYAGVRVGFEPWHVLVVGCVPIVVAGFGWLWWFRHVYFFRDPRRVPPAGDDLIVSPADGRVMYVYEVRAGDVVSDKQGRKIRISELAKTDLGETRGWLIGIYMTPFDVHFSRTPIAGHISTLYYHRTGANLPMVDLWEYVNFTLFRRAINMFAAPFHLENERMTIEVCNEKIACFIILIADKFVNKITTFFRQGQQVGAGEKICFIERGSQTDLFITQPERVAIEVKPGDQVHAGTTIIGRIGRLPSVPVAIT